MWGRLDGKQAGEQRNEDHADYGHTSARHELYNAKYEKIFARMGLKLIKK